MPAVVKDTHYRNFQEKESGIWLKKINRPNDDLYKAEIAKSS